MEESADILGDIFDFDNWVILDEDEQDVKESTTPVTVETGSKACKNTKTAVGNSTVRNSAIKTNAVDKLEVSYHENKRQPGKLKNSSSFEADQKQKPYHSKGSSNVRTKSVNEQLPAKHGASNRREKRNDLGSKVIKQEIKSPIREADGNRSKNGKCSSRDESRHRNKSGNVDTPSRSSCKNENDSSKIESKSNKYERSRKDYYSKRDGNEKNSKDVLSRNSKSVQVSSKNEDKTSKNLRKSGEKSSKSSSTDLQHKNNSSTHSKRKIDLSSKKSDDKSSSNLASNKDSSRKSMGNDNSSNRHACGKGLVNEPLSRKHVDSGPTAQRTKDKIHPPQVKCILLLGDGRYNCLSSLVPNILNKKFCVITKPDMNIVLIEKMLKGHIINVPLSKIQDTLFMCTVSLDDLIKVDDIKDDIHHHKIFSLLHPPSYFVSNIMTALHRLRQITRSLLSKNKDVHVEVVVLKVWPVNLLDYYVLINECTPPPHYAPKLKSLQDQLSSLIISLNEQLKQSSLIVPPEGLMNPRNTSLFNGIACPTNNLVKGIYPPKAYLKQFSLSMEMIIKHCVDTSLENNHYTHYLVGGDSRLQNFKMHWPQNHKIHPDVVAGDIGPETLSFIIEKHIFNNDLFVFSPSINDHLVYKQDINCKSHEPLKYPSFSISNAQNPVLYASKLVNVILEFQIQNLHNEILIVPTSVVPLDLLRERKSIAKKHAVTNNHKVEGFEQEAELETIALKKYVDELNKEIQDTCLIHNIFFISMIPPMKNSKYYDDPLISGFLELFHNLFKEIPVTSEQLAVRHQPISGKQSFVELDNFQSYTYIKGPSTGPDTDLDFDKLARTGQSVKHFLAHVDSVKSLSTSELRQRHSPDKPTNIADRLCAPPFPLSCSPPRSHPFKRIHDLRERPDLGCERPDPGWERSHHHGEPPASDHNRIRPGLGRSDSIEFGCPGLIGLEPNQFVPNSSELNSFGPGFHAFDPNGWRGCPGPQGLESEQFLPNSSESNSFSLGFHTFDPNGPPDHRPVGHQPVPCEPGFNGPPHHFSSVPHATRSYGSHGPFPMAHGSLSQVIGPPTPQHLDARGSPHCREESPYRVVNYGISRLVCWYYGYYVGY